MAPCNVLFMRVECVPLMRGFQQMEVMTIKLRHQLNTSRTLLWKKVHINLHRPLTQTPHNTAVSEKGGCLFSTHLSWEDSRGPII
jgi:hypothetical protein